MRVNLNSSDLGSSRVTVVSVVLDAGDVIMTKP